MTTKEDIYDPLEGVTTKTTKEDLMDRLRKAAAVIRRQDRKKKSRLQEVEERIRAKGSVQPELLIKVICSATEEEWQATVEFLEEFEGTASDNLLPVGLQRLVQGGRVLLGQSEAAG